MNYLSHGFRFLKDPYFLLGTAIPDMMNVVNRKCKVRSKHAEPFLEHKDPRARSLAAGIIQHHFDDRWFHQARAFNELCLEFTVSCRDILSQEKKLLASIDLEQSQQHTRDGLRAGFLGHILVELLMDAELLFEDPTLGDAYYRQLAKTDFQFAEKIIDEIGTQSAIGIARLLPLFLKERFLLDYSTDQGLLYRLNRVMERVKLSVLPDSIVGMFSPARKSVKLRQSELLNFPGVAQTTLAIENR